MKLITMKNIIIAVIIVIIIVIFWPKKEKPDILPPELTLEQVTEMNSPYVYVIWKMIKVPNVKFTITVKNNPPEERSVDVLAQGTGTGFAVTRHDILTNSHVTSVETAVNNQLDNILKWEKQKNNTNNVVLSNIHYDKQNYKRKILIIHSNWKEPFAVEENSIKETKNADMAWLHVEEDMGIYYPLKVDTFEPKIGHVVYTLGYPGYTASLSQQEHDVTWLLSEMSKRPITGRAGTVNKSRSLKADMYWGNVGQVYEHSAVINPGNSGGPLFNVYGNVIGINTFHDKEANAYFSIAISEVKKVFPDLWEKIKEFEPREPEEIISEQKN